MVVIVLAQDTIDKIRNAEQAAIDLEQKTKEDCAKKINDAKLKASNIVEDYKTSAKEQRQKLVDSANSEAKCELEKSKELAKKQCEQIEQNALKNQDKITELLLKKLV